MGRTHRATNRLNRVRMTMKACPSMLLRSTITIHQPPLADQWMTDVLQVDVPTFFPAKPNAGIHAIGILWRTSYKDCQERMKTSKTFSAARDRYQGPIATVTGQEFLLRGRDAAKYGIKFFMF